MHNHRFHALDGMRGVAALAVLLFHVCLNHASWVFQHGYLAVDFFFILSGFVIAYAYEDRLRHGMPWGRFTTARVIRLYPLIFAGAVVGLLGFIKVYDRGTMAAIFGTGLLLIPTPFATASEDFTAMPVNPPSWSLFYEFLINGVYMLLAKRLSNRLLAVIVGVSALALVGFIVVFGGATFGSRWPNFAVGFVRVCFSFFAGVALFRLWQAKRLPRVAVPWPILFLGLVLLFQVPTVKGFDIAFDALAILVAFPLVVAWGAQMEVGRAGLALSHIGGELSYPLYILQGGIAPKIRDLPPKLGLYGPGALALILGLVAVYAGVCWIALKVYDEPVRQFLTRRFLRSGRTVSAPASSPDSPCAR